MQRLPERVRARVVVLAAEALGALRPDEVPASLHAVARFTPAKRARAGAAALVAALEAEPQFRRRVVSHARTVHPELATALSEGGPATGRPEDLAAVAYLLGTEGWEERVAAVAEALEQRTQERESDALHKVTAQLEAAAAAAQRDLAAAQEEARLAKNELAVVRRKARDLGSRLGRAEAQQQAAEAERDALRAELALAQERQAAELRTLTLRLDEAKGALDQARQAQREGTRGDQLRLRLLLDSVVNAAGGLRRELALPPAEGRPADRLAADYARPAGGPAAQGRNNDDPALLDALLAVPMTHLLVDGYNVTKTGYPALALEAQRTRLLAGLGALAARTQAEVTVVFDGATGAVPVAVPAPRGVRLLFSRTGETADEVLRRLARHEPQGRPVVVVSTDREVADGVREAGATAVPSTALLGLLEKGPADRSVGGGA